MRGTLADVDLSVRLKKSVYARRLPELQTRLAAILQAHRAAGRSAVIVFEGWDAAGKGGAIRRLSAELDPRGYKVWPIGAPRPFFQKRHYLARFWDKLPPEGAFAVFDRSWYGRVLVERVEGFASAEEWRRAYREINEFERLLVDDGVQVLKYFLHVSDAEQLSRFADRLRDPAKRWKLTEDDFRNRSKRAAYEAAIDEMLARTSTDVAPWRVVSGEQKRFARISILDDLCARLSDGLDLTPPRLDPAVRAAAAEAFGAASDVMRGLEPAG